MHFAKVALLLVPPSGHTRLMKNSFAQDRVGIHSYTPRAQMMQHAERAAPEEAEEILAAGSVAHAGFMIGAQPFVIPLSYHYSRENPRKLYMHGALNSRAVLQ